VTRSSYVFVKDLLVQHEEKMVVVMSNSGEAAEDSGTPGA
jgi:hypothetical protein